MINISTTDYSLETILSIVLSECVSTNEEMTYSAAHKENERIREIISKSALALLERLKLRVGEKLEISRGIEEEFEAVVLRTWRKPLDLLDLLLYLSFEGASEFDSVNGSEKSLEHNAFQAALVRQQTTACLVANEIIHLLKSGFPSGAHSH